MSYNYCKDHRSGITYVYEISSQIDESGKRTTSRKLIGKLDEAGNVIPTSGRRGRLPKPDRDHSVVKFENEEEYVQTIEMQKKQIEALNETVRQLQEEKENLVGGLQKLLNTVR